jgi:hypothetical protein
VRWGTLIAAPMALTSLFLVPEYWTPLSPFDLDQKIRIGVEDFLWPRQAIEAIFKAKRAMSDESPKSRAKAMRVLPATTEARVWSDGPSWPDIVFLGGVGLAGILGVCLRWRGLGSQSLWLDEGFTLWITRFAPHEIWQLLRVDTGPPLHYILIHYWSMFFGSSEFWLRALSAVFGTLSVPLFYLLARKILADRTAVVIAMATYAVSFFQIWYAKEARPYGLLIFLSLGSVYCLLLYLENRDPVRFCAVVLFLVASLYTHNMALSYLPGIMVLWFVYPGQKKLFARVREGLLIGSAVLVFYLPWLPTLAAQSGRMNRGWWLTAVPGMRDLVNSVCMLSGFDPNALQTAVRNQLHIHVSRLFGYWTWVPLILIAIVVCILGGLFVPHKADRRKTIALFVYAFSPVALTFVLSRISTPVYINRVFSGCSSVLPILFAAPMAFQVGNPRKVFQAIGLLIFVGGALSAAGFLRRERKEDWRGVTEYLMRLPERERLAVIVPDIALPLVYYYMDGQSTSVPSVQVTGLLTQFDPPDEDLEKRLFRLKDANTDVLALLSHAVASRRYKEIDVALQLNSWPQGEKPMLGYLATHCRSIEVVEFSMLEVRRCFVPSTSGS